MHCCPVKKTLFKALLRLYRQFIILLKFEWKSRQGQEMGPSRLIRTWSLILCYIWRLFKSPLKKQWTSIMSFGRFVLFCPNRNSKAQRELIRIHQDKGWQRWRRRQTNDVSVDFDFNVDVNFDFIVAISASRKSGDEWESEATVWNISTIQL